MIAAVMVFLALTSIVVGVAAWLADAGLRRLRRTSRWVWMAALWAPPVLLALAWTPFPTLFSFLGGGAGAAGPLSALPTVELPGLVVGPGGVGGASSPLLGALWAAASLGTLLVLLRAHRSLAREREGWRVEAVLGERVQVSERRGPAVSGLRDPWVVLPTWTLALPEAELRLVLTHEVEHLRARDPLLLAAGWAAVLTMPWNPMAWWQLRRMRGAMEVDCDRRVLARHPDRRSYGSSLLSVAERASGSSLALAAFSERSSNLEQRIRTMTDTTNRRTQVLGAVLFLLAAAVGVQACGVDSPLAPAGGVDRSSGVVGDSTPAPTPPPEAAALMAEPTFTPFTAAPSITNRSEVIQAMRDEYPPLLREAGIGGTVRVYLFVDAEGVVRSTRVDTSSGHEALDRAALNVAGVYDFTPALNGDDRVPVWVSFPITFQLDGAG